MKYSRLRRREAAPWLNRCRPQVESLESRDLLSVSVTQAHAGISFSQSGFQPPDTVGAIGPNYYVEEVNTSIAIYNKSTGAQVSLRGMGTFFSPLGGVQMLSDPFVFYDQLAGKFVTGILDFTSAVSRIDLAVSNTSDPTGAWTFHRYDTTNDGSSNHLTDYPRFGYNHSAYVISYNQFGNTSVHVDTLAIDKTNLASSFTHVWPTTTVAAPGMSPTIMHDDTAGTTMWFVGTGSGANVKVLKMTNPLSASPTTTLYTITVPSYTAYSPSMAIRQPGGSDTVQSDSRILNAAMRGGMLVAAHTVGITGAHVAQWYEFNTTGASPTLTQSGRINPNASTTDTYYPTIDINAAGALGMTYIESGTSEYQSMYVTGRTTSDPSGTMETGMVPTGLGGTARYTSTRAGDYSGMSVDPSDNSTFWAANQFRGSAAWNTGFAGFSLGGSVGVATHYSVTAVATAVAGSPFTVTVKALDASGSTATGYRGTVTFSSGDPYGATLPGNYTFTAADSGTHTFTSATALYTVGSWDVTATDTVNTSITGSATVRVTPAAAAGFYIVSSADSSGTVAGNAFDVTVYAVDPYGNVATGYRGTVTFSSGDPYGASLPNNYTFTAFDVGVHTFRAATALYTAGTWDVTATDINSGITGSDYVNVIAAPAAGFYVAAPASSGSGVPFDATVYAVDPYGNVDTNYGGTVTWTSTDGDPGVVLPADYAFQPSDQGVVTYASGAGNGFTLITPGDQLIIPTDTVSGITGSADVFVTSPGPGAASHRHSSAALAVALPKSTPALPVSSTAADQTLVLSGGSAEIGQVENPGKQALQVGNGHGLVTQAPADWLGTAVLDLVLADWNQGLSPIESAV